MADEATAAATATTATIGEEAPAAVAAPAVEAAPELAEAELPPGPPTKKAQAHHTPEHRKLESKKMADPRSTLDQRKRETAATEERQRAAEQLLQLKTEAKSTVLQEQQAQAMLFYGHPALGQHMIIPATGAASVGSSASSVTRPLPPRSTAPPTAPSGHEMGAHGRHAYQSRDGSPEVGESMTGPSPSSIDLNRAPANSKGPKNLGAAATSGARNLFDDLSAARVIRLQRIDNFLCSMPHY
ncbi:uncharacterized protein [Lolium perenne]|uniref:uncharacterized protein n=1 Tax=Lolium perenne TaxID=4522 RepID=UPI003A98D4CB